MYVRTKNLRAVTQYLRHAQLDFWPTTRDSSQHLTILSCARSGTMTA